MHTRKSQRGFTLIEFLVVAAIIVIGLALAAPAVQQSRAQAQQSICQNNLKLMSLAMFNYHDVHNVFPPAWVAKESKAGNGPRYGWLTFLLPYMDQGILYDDIIQTDDVNGFHHPVPAADYKHPRTGTALFQTSPDVYRCPSDTTSATNPMRGGYGTSNYSANHGNVPLPRWSTGRGSAFWPGQVDTPRKANGIMYWNSRIGFRNITDGASNTFLVGERCVTSAAGIWPGVGSNEFENDAATDCSHGSRLNRHPTSFSSAHVGGANFLFCDGSVKFINDDIDSQPATEGELGTYQRLSNRHDGLTVEDF